MPSKRQRKSDNIHVYACILLHIEIEAKLRPRMCVRFVLRFLASAFSKLNPCISPSLFFFFVIRFLLREFFFFPFNLRSTNVGLSRSITTHVLLTCLFIHIICYHLLLDTIICNERLLSPYLHDQKSTDIRSRVFLITITINILHLIIALAANRNL